ncbi:Histone-lysine N-methyltransferase SETMAR [Eumeta japonica]|uniref:Histone-lysine N-methyltransferase SETMAR n=1 Tax=Eumeta variegata TaxID=151549 RepID=A0A4C1VTU0_EUMVA|nr:Histone-lysine N-methyltransferase SETMAR [Eumeta japonica]
MIFYDIQLRANSKTNQLTSIFGDEAPSKTTVCEFNSGRSILTDEFKESRPKSVVVPQSICDEDAVRELTMQDRHVTYREIKASLSINDESWISVYDPQTKQQLTVWVFQDEPIPTKGIRAKVTLKQMVACFFGINEPVVAVPLENRKTINSEWYTTISVPEVFEEIRKNNRQRRIILYHDNVRCHTSAETTRFLEGQKINLTGHPPYSSDLAPNDFYLFPCVKNKLRGERFSSREEAVDAFKMHVLEIPQSEWKKCYKNWSQRMQMCINHHGEYFEKE